MSEKIWVLQGDALRDRATKTKALDLVKTACLEEGDTWLRLTKPANFAVDAPEIANFCKDNRLDIAEVDADLKLSDFDAIFFDMDSTLCQTETLDEMASILGVGETCAQITHDAMTGKIADYAASLKARVALLKDMPSECIETVYAGMKPNPGVETLLAKAQAMGLKTYIVSSGFTCLTERMRARLNMTATCANRIEIVDGHFTGRVFGPVDETILDASGKAAFVQKTMAELGSTVDRAICCGDGSNDIKMIDLAGFGVGFRPKPILRPHCNAALDYVGFDGLLNIFADTH